MKNLENLSDRDLLVKCTTNIENLCSKFKSIEAKNDSDHELIYKKVDRLTEYKVSNKLFYFVIGLIIAGLLSLATFTGALKNDVVINTTRLNSFDSRGM